MIKNKFIIQIFNVNEENLKNLKNYKQTLINNSDQENNKEHKQRMEYMIGHILLNTKLIKLLEENESMRKQLKKLKKESSLHSYSQDGSKKRRKRKLKNEIVRNFKCSHPHCHKAYGSENALNQHMKIKHEKHLT